jgi:hypothetical protein
MRAKVGNLVEIRTGSVWPGWKPDHSGIIKTRCIAAHKFIICTINYSTCPTFLSFSPKLYARIGGIAYLVIIIAGALGELFIRDKLVVAGDAQATANNISASPLLWRLGIAGDLVMHLCDIVVMLVFYTLLRPVNRNIALMALLFNFTRQLCS